ncbi:aspartate/glutamate racemase family protein [Streptococcus merionis]|uniref:aspartate/glutamate racemase family protein n=1 Tax=Streptococcus merionis TaxID=400065 RepID=UPI0026ED35BC|nr:aspartate/glutamate racemase family protein [Streptococcus merionis]
MKTIGLIGGMSWESTASYYQIINEVIKKELGGLHSAKILLYSVDFAEIEHYQATGEWGKSAQVLGEVAANLEKAGADFIVICTNTMHKVVPQIQQRINIPILHIAQATAEVLLEQGIQKVGLLGTKYTMTQDFYKEKLIELGLEVCVPDSEGIESVNSIIYNELCLGKIREESKQIYLDIIEQLRNEGAQAVILGCTEIGLLVKQEDTDMPLFDTTLIHAEAAAMMAIRMS